jgi:hypothetical protein
MNKSRKRNLRIVTLENSFHRHQIKERVRSHTIAADVLYLLSIKYNRCSYAMNNNKRSSYGERERERERENLSQNHLPFGSASSLTQAK